MESEKETARELSYGTSLNDLHDLFKVTLFNVK